jgi:hypothetical protein
MKRNTFPSEKSRITITRVLLLSTLLPLILSGCQLLQNALQPMPTATVTPFIPTLFVPTQDCGPSTLVLGTNTFQIETIQAGADGTFAVPSDKSGIAYWVDGTNRNYTFVLSPTPENLAILPALITGSTAKVTWSNCNSTTYTLGAQQPTTFGPSALPDQTVDSITVFFQSEVSGAGFVLSGELTEEQISTFGTPVPGDVEIQAEIALLETTTAPDGGSIRVGVSIQNYGATAFTLSGTDVTLTQQDGTAVSMLSSEPPLPRPIAPGTIETIYFFFSRPASPTATLKLLTVEYELEGY